MVNDPRASKPLRASTPWSADSAPPKLPADSIGDSKPSSDPPSWWSMKWATCS